MDWLRSNQIRVFAAAGVVGAGFLCAKGAIRATSGDDVSLVPAFLFFLGFGLLGLAAVVADTGRLSAMVLLGRVLAVVGILAGAIALAYVLTGTIPETDDAPATVGVSYGLGAAATFLGQLVLGIAAVRTEALPGRLRWAPIGVVILQFPVFIVAGAIGDGIGDETVTDGLGMLLTGALWATSSVAVWIAGGMPANEPTPVASPA